MQFECKFPERLAAKPARRLLQGWARAARAAFAQRARRHAAHAERQAELFREIRGGGGVCFRIRAAQPVIHVARGEAQGAFGGERCERVQQHARIDSA